MLEDLSDREAEVVRLYHLQYLNYRQIGKQLGIPENSVGPILAKARRRLRRTAEQGATRAEPSAGSHHELDGPPTRRSAVCAILCLLLGPARRQDRQRATYPTIGTIERIDPRFDRLVPRDAVIEKLAEGFDWSEGPVWVTSGGYLLFSDVPRNTVFRGRRARGRASSSSPAATPARPLAAASRARTA